MKYENKLNFRYSLISRVSGKVEKEPSVYLSMMEVHACVAQGVWPHSLHMNAGFKIYCKNNPLLYVLNVFIFGREFRNMLLDTLNFFFWWPYLCCRWYVFGPTSYIADLHDTRNNSFNRDCFHYRIFCHMQEWFESNKIFYCLHNIWNNFLPKIY